MGHADGRAQSPKRSDSSLDLAPGLRSLSSVVIYLACRWLLLKQSVFLKHEKGTIGLSYRETRMTPKGQVGIHDSRLVSMEQCSMGQASF